MNEEEMAERICQLEKELKKKDKIIDVVIFEYMDLSRKLIFEDYTAMLKICFGCKFEKNKDCNGKDCIKRIKEYISEKVEEEKDVCD